MTLSYSERLETMLSEIASRYGVREARGTLITLELGHEDWAAMIGSSRPMASRLLADMARHHRLAREGKRYILFADSRPVGPNLGALGNGAAHKPGATAARPRASA